MLKKLRGASLLLGVGMLMALMGSCERTPLERKTTSGSYDAQAEGCELAAGGLQSV